MHLNSDISEALALLEQLQTELALAPVPEEHTTCGEDLQLLISALENPALRGQALLQDSLGHLRHQLLKDPSLTVDGFDITFAGRLLLDDGHYCEPVYESADESRGCDHGQRKGNNLSTPPAGSQGPKSNRKDYLDNNGHKLDTGGFKLPQRHGDHPQDPRRKREAPRHPWAVDGNHHPLARPATAPPPLPQPPPLLSIPLQTAAPVLLAPTPQTPGAAILLQIPLLPADHSTAGLTINDLYLGRVTPPVGGEMDERGGVAALLRASSVDSDRSANGSDTASSVNSGSGWSKSSSIVRVSYGDGNEPKRYAETSPNGTTPATTKEASTLDRHALWHSPTPQSYPLPYPYPCSYPYPHYHQQRHLPASSDDDSYPPDDVEVVWSPVPTAIELLKGARGLGFSIGEQRHPAHPRGAVVVVRSLVAGGVAQADGRLRPGDRLVAVNGRPLTEGSLDEAVRALKGAPPGPVTVGVLRRVWREVGRAEEGHYEEIDEKKETRERGEQEEQRKEKKERGEQERIEKEGVGDDGEHMRQKEDQENGDREADTVKQPSNLE